MEITLEHAQAAKEHLSKIFWLGIEKRLEEVDERDYTHVSNEQAILRGLTLLHYEIKGLKKEQDNVKPVLKALECYLYDADVDSSLKKLVDAFDNYKRTINNPNKG